VGWDAAIPAIDADDHGNSETAVVRFWAQFLSIDAAPELLALRLVVTFPRAP
jgi:hypothetical protein